MEQMPCGGLKHKRLQEEVQLSGHGVHALPSQLQV